MSSMPVVARSSRAKYSLMWSVKSASTGEQHRQKRQSQQHQLHRLSERIRHEHPVQRAPINRHIQDVKPGAQASRTGDGGAQPPPDPRGLIPQDRKIDQQRAERREHHEHFGAGQPQQRQVVHDPPPCFQAETSGCTLGTM
ncbi:MAG: hypothetical protein M5U12_29780 [Verrucomicrobia bacterium]|nr:hypothetical protein [Verrucomicrobiota bacterium]